MPESLEDLVELLDLEMIDVDLFRGRQPHTSMQRVFGGQVLGQALAAASRTSIPSGSCTRCTGTSCAPATPPYRSSTARSRPGTAARSAVAGWSRRRTASRSSTCPRPSSGRSPGWTTRTRCRTTSYRRRRRRRLATVLEARSGRKAADWDKEWAALDVRLAGVTGRQFWIRAAGKLPDDPALHACVLAYASDLTLLGASLLPHGIVIGDRRIQPASLDHALWFHREFRADEWLLYDQVVSVRVRRPRVRHRPALHRGRAPHRLSSAGRPHPPGRPGPGRERLAASDTVEACRSAL